jgi:crotonobetainyl-CoA:carnitine CoA-transferase CaiB-like acyl-CoA transferase
MPFPRASQALSRFTVLDLTRIRSGPTAVRQFADWGANVIKIDALSDDAGSSPAARGRARTSRTCTATSGP